MSAPVGVALLGFGSIAERVHAPVLADLPGVRIVSVAEPDPQRQEAAQARTGAQVCSSWEEALDVHGVDAVVVSVPSGLHVSAGEAVLDHGLHLYLEKPLATDLASASRLVGLWRDSGRVGMIGFNYRFNPLIGALRNQLSTGAVGEVLAVRSVFSVAGGESVGWRARPDEGGGAMLDLGVHHFDLLPFILGDPIEAVVGATDHGGKEESLSTQLRTRGGVMVQCLFSRASVNEDRIEVHGTGGKLVVDRYRSTGPEPWRGPGVTAAVAGLVGRVGSLVHPYRLRRHFSPGREPSYRLALEAFVRAVRAGSGGSPDLADGLDTQAVVEAVRESARGGRAVAVAGEVRS